MPWRERGRKGGTGSNLGQDEVRGPGWVRLSLDLMPWWGAGVLANPPRLAHRAHEAGRVLARGRDPAPCTHPLLRPPKRRKPRSKITRLLPTLQEGGNCVCQKARPASLWMLSAVFLSHDFHIKLSSHDPVCYISVPFFFFSLHALAACVPH